MQVPQRKSEAFRKHNDDGGAYYLTPAAKLKLEEELVRLEHHDQPAAIAEVSRTREHGDLSENAGYQEAKARLRGMQSRILFIKEKLKRIVIIKNSQSGFVELGSRITVRVNDREQTFHIVGPHEANPAQGSISHVSPIGAALVGHVKGDKITINTPGGEIMYEILKVE